MPKGRGAAARTVALKLGGMSGSGKEWEDACNGDDGGVSKKKKKKTQKSRNVWQKKKAKCSK
jgi:hypothetical protein